VEPVWNGKTNGVCNVVLPFQTIEHADDADGSHRDASHTTWQSFEAFAAWTQSDAFRQAHAGNPMPEELMLRPPHLMLWAGWPKAGASPAVIAQAAGGSAAEGASQRCPADVRPFPGEGW
jgi:hypothetical protein